MDELAQRAFQNAGWKPEEVSSKDVEKAQRDWELGKYSTQDLLTELFYRNVDEDTYRGFMFSMSEMLAGRETEGYKGSDDL